MDLKIRFVGIAYCRVFPYDRFLLCLSRHCDEGKQDGDDGLLVHISYFDIFKQSLAEGILPL